MLAINLDLPIYYVFFCLFIGIIFSYFLYLSSGNINSKKLIWGLFTLRTIFISFLAFLLLNPVFKSLINISEKPIVIIAKDNSKSIKENINEDLQFISENLDDFDLFKYSFSDKITNGITKVNNGLKTNYSNFFNEISNKFENRNVAGLILASDGCYNIGSNPEYLSYDFPIYSIALGDTSLYKDLRIDEVLINDISFLGNSFPLEISIASTLVKDEESNLKIWNDSVIVYEEPINFKNILNYQTKTVLLSANKVGLQTYTIEIEGLDDEKSLANNFFNVYIDIIDTRSRVLILKDGNTPDLFAYKSAIESNINNEVVVKDISESFILDQYQLAVLFQVSDLPKNIINHSIPLIVFNSTKSHNNLLNYANNSSKKIVKEEVITIRSEAFSKFSFSSELLSLISDAPYLFCSHGNFKFGGNIEPILNMSKKIDSSKFPIIALQESDSRKLAFITAEGWWKWKLYDYSVNNNNLAFDELFSKLSQYLLLKEDKSLFRLFYNGEYEENNEVIFRAALYNESYELVNNKDINLKLVDKSNMEYNFKFLKEGDELYSNLGILKSGKYNFIANVSGTELIKKGIFDIKEIQLEQRGLSANHKVLNNISDISNGKVFYPNNIKQLIRTIKDSDNNIKVLHYKDNLESLINIPYILMCLIILISIEWAIRKYNGLI